MGRSISEIKGDIGKVLSELDSCKQQLEDIKRRYDLQKEKIWDDYRFKSDELSDKIFSSQEKLSYYENEISSRNERIRQLEEENRGHEGDYRHSGDEIERMRNDDIPDREQVYDFEREYASADRAERHSDQNRREIEQLQSEIEEFTNKYHHKEAEIGDLNSKGPDLRQERKDKHYQCKIYFDDLAAPIRRNLQDLNSRLKDLRAELSAAYEEKHEKEEHKDELDAYDNHSESYQHYVDNKFEDENTDDENLDEDGRPYGKHLEREKNKTSETYGVEDNSYADAQNILEKYAQRVGQKFAERNKNQGYEASVGETKFNFINSGKAVLSRKDDIPSVEDFVTMLNIQKSNGKNMINFSKADSDEYRARMMIACHKVGMRSRGYTKIEDVNSLDEETCKNMLYLPELEKNPMLRQKLEERLKNKKNQSSTNNLYWQRMQNQGR